MCIFVIYIEFFPYCFFVSNSQVIGCEDCLRNDLYCVGWGVKLCSIQSLQLASSPCRYWPSPLWYSSVISFYCTEALKFIVYYHIIVSVKWLFKMSADSGNRQQHQSCGGPADYWTSCDSLLISEVWWMEKSEYLVEIYYRHKSWHMCHGGLLLSCLLYGIYGL